MEDDETSFSSRQSLRSSSRYSAEVKPLMASESATTQTPHAVSFLQALHIPVSVNHLPLRYTLLFVYSHTECALVAV